MIESWPRISRRPGIGGTTHTVRMSERSEKSLGIPPRDMRESDTLDLLNLWWRLCYAPRSFVHKGGQAFHERPGEAMRASYQFASFHRMRTTGITADHHRTQVLVFRQQGPRGGDDDRFSYLFATGVDGIAGRSGVRLLEPEPGLELSQIFFRNDYGPHRIGWACICIALTRHPPYVSWRWLTRDICWIQMSRLLLTIQVLAVREVQ